MSRGNRNRDLYGIYILLRGIKLLVFVVGVEIDEPSVSTILMNFENKFDPYGAVSTPLYQTATFKQVIA